MRIFTILYRTRSFVFFLLLLSIAFYSGLFGKSVREQDENTYITSYGYDNNGNIISRTTPNNDTIKYTYDKLNRLTKITYPDSREIFYAYDANNNKIKVTDVHGTIDYFYDKFN